MNKRTLAQKAEKFRRTYHSLERVEFVKAQPCYAALVFGTDECCDGAIHNAHTVSGGLAFKADYGTIIPLCARHHKCYDEHRTPFDRERERMSAKIHAGRIQEMWEIEREDAA